MNLFKRRHFKNDIIIWAVHWYCRYGISYRDLEEMLEERGIKVDHSTINRWVIFYAPKMMEKLKKYWKPGYSKTWHVDETYVKVKGKWTYLYRAINKDGHTIDFWLSENRDCDAAEHFLRKSLKGLEEFERPKTINTDGHFGYKGAIPMLKVTDDLSRDVKHQKIKYLNNRIESDHGKLKRLIKPTLGFKALHSARATIAGFELMRMFKKGQFRNIPDVRSQARFISKAITAC